MVEFTFLHPKFLFFLFAIPILFVIHFLSLTNRKKVALKFANFNAIARIQGIDFFSKNLVRSEERRVGKECRSRWSPYH